MKRLQEAILLLAAGMFSMAGLCASAQPRPSLECEQKLIGQGFNIIERISMMIYTSLKQSGIIKSGKSKQIRIAMFSWSILTTSNIDCLQGAKLNSMHSLQNHINPKAWNKPLLTNTSIQTEVNATRLIAAISNIRGLRSAWTDPPLENAWLISSQ